MEIEKECCSSSFGNGKIMALDLNLVLEQDPYGRTRSTSLDSFCFECQVDCNPMGRKIRSHNLVGKKMRIKRKVSTRAQVRERCQVLKRLHSCRLGSFTC